MVFIWIPIFLVSDIEYLRRYHVAGFCGRGVDVLSRISLAHGAGGREMRELIERISRLVPQYLRSVGGAGLDALDDGAVIPLPGGLHMVIAIDSFTVSPQRFPGGDIGSLAAHGVINDLVAMGAKPLAVLDAVIVEEGMDIEELESYLKSFIDELAKAGVALIGGDLKVVPKGSLDRIVISVAGIGIARRPIVDRPRPRDKIVVTGPIAEHGATILAAQLNLLDKFPNLRSDTKPLLHILPILEKFSDRIHAVRDPTRGGLAATLWEWARETGLTAVIDLERIPIREEVKSFLEAMGVDPLSMACEGVAVLAVDEEIAEEVVKELRAAGEPYADIVGEFVEPRTPIEKGRIIGVTEIGGRIFIEPRPIPLPRIC